MKLQNLLLSDLLLFLKKTQWREAPAKALTVTVRLQSGHPFNQEPSP